MQEQDSNIVVTTNEPQQAETSDGIVEWQPANQNEAAAAEQPAKTTDESATTEPEAKDESKEAEKPNGIQKRLDKLTREKNEALREVERLKAEQTPKVDMPKVEAQASEPNPEDFESQSDYVKALVKYEREQENQARAAAEQQTKAQQAQQARATSFAKQVDLLRETAKDVDEVYAAVDDINVSPFVLELASESNNGAAVMYELAKNRDEFERINSLPALAAAREFGKFEAKLEAPKASTKPTTNAPAPIKPVAGNGAPVIKNEDEMSDDEWAASQRRTK